MKILGRMRVTLKGFFKHFQAIFMALKEDGNIVMGMLVFMALKTRYFNAEYFQKYFIISSTSTPNED